MATNSTNLKTSDLTKNPFADLKVSSNGDWVYNLGAILGGLWAKNYNERGLAKGEATGQAMLDSMNNEANPLNSVGSNGDMTSKLATNPIDDFDITKLSNPQSESSGDALFKDFSAMMDSNGSGGEGDNAFALWMSKSNG